ncbi:MAG TPA: hypothetical protein VM096_05870 [Vicinamibacterales bacterium]|nr:hypothetical protein [Vicinamibacterales bacterium]
MNERLQLLWLFVLAAPIACVAWTVTHEEVFREVHEWCLAKSGHATRWYQRKFFYLFTCEYCFSHYVAAGAILITGYRLLLPDWRGFFIAWFTLVWVANVYMSLFGRLRLDIKRERVGIKLEEKVVEKVEDGDLAIPLVNAVAPAPRLAAAVRPPTRPANTA